AYVSVPSRTTDSVRSRPPDSRLARPAASARGRPPLLRLLSSRIAGRAADLHRSRSGDRDECKGATAAGCRFSGGRSGSRAGGDLLFNYQLPGRIAWRVVWELPHQTGG